MLIATDPLSLVFIGCFVFGLLFLLVTTLLGNLGHGHAGTHAVAHHGPVHAGGHTAAPGVGHAAVHAPAHAPTHTPAHTTGHTTHAQSTGSGARTGVLSSLFSYINLTTLVFFLIGFGLFGYIFHNTLPIITLLAIVLAIISGLIIAALLILMLNRIFGNSEGETVQDVSDRTGMVGKVSMTIKENSLGEVIYVSPGGMRQSMPARSIDGRRLERGQEVVIINSEGGVAEVDTWEHFIGEEEAQFMPQSSTAASVDELAKLRTLLDESPKADTELVIRKDVQKE